MKSITFPARSAVTFSIGDRVIITGDIVEIGASWIGTEGVVADIDYTWDASTGNGDECGNCGVVILDKPNLQA